MSYWDELRESFSNGNEDTTKDKGVDYLSVSPEMLAQVPLEPTSTPINYIKRNSVDGGMVDSMLSSSKNAGTPEKSWWK